MVIDDGYEGCAAMLFFVDIALGCGLLLLSLCIECSYSFRFVLFDHNKFIFIPLNYVVKALVKNE